MANSLFSKEMQEQLKSLKSELSKTRAGDDIGSGINEKPTEPVTLPTKKQVQKKVQQFDSEFVDDEKVLFMQAMAGVQPIAKKNTISNIAKPKAKLDATTLSKRAAAEGEDSKELSSGLSDMQALLNPVAGDAYLLYKTETLQNKVFNQLKQGKLRWYDAVDIHGCTIDEARTAMTQLITQAKANGETVVKIVHGKGEDAVLKTCVNGWLRQIPEVLAFCSAPPRDGGNGAVLVLLKKNKANA